MSLFRDAAAAVRAGGARGRVRFPSPEYRRDPGRFFREILGLHPWAKQTEVLESVRDNARTTWKSGHRVGKSNVAAGLALWFYCSFEDARVVLTAPTARQVDDILWRELRMMRMRSGRCIDCKANDPQGPRPCAHSAMIEGELADKAKSGLVSDDFREIRGFTAREVEAIQGIAGRNLFFIIDECSGVADDLFEGLEGNRAGWSASDESEYVIANSAIFGKEAAAFEKAYRAGAVLDRSDPGTVRELLTGNPTKTSGKFFRSFTDESKHYRCITTSSEESPNVAAGRVVVPGLATRDWIEEKKEMWGEGSPLYLVRVKGEFALHEDGKIFSVHAIEEAEQRWHDTPSVGRLYIGLDPSGESGTGDEAVFAPRRGQKLLALLAFRGLSPEAHLVQLLSIAGAHRREREPPPVVVVDREGSVGAQLYGFLRNYVETNDGAFELVAVRASDRAIRHPQIYDRMRDELTGNFEAWLREGGAILEDTKLAGEMHELEWKQAVNGRLKVTPKEAIRKALKRSPDRYDAVALSVWEPLSLREELPESAAELAAREDRANRMDDDHGAGGFDPYAGMEPLQPRRR